MVFPNKCVGVLGANLFSVDLCEPLERITGDDNITCSGVWMVCQVTGLQVIKNGSLKQKANGSYELFGMTTGRQ